jgi:hypothetical protein
MEVGPTVLQMHLDSGTIWRFTHPRVEILSFPGFKEEHIVAVVQFSKLVQLVELGLGVELCLFSAVWPSKC